MQSVVARSLVRGHRSPIVQSSAPTLAKLPYHSGANIAATSAFLDSTSLRSASNYANRSAIRRQVKLGAQMANVQPYLRVGARNMGGEAPLDIEVFGKAAIGTGSPSNVRGDCPFTQRVLLDLNEKNIPYKATYIQEGNDKPDWFLEKNPSGLMPVLRDGETWVQDSDKIAQHLEEKFPTPPLKTPAKYKNIGEGIFPAFTSWLKTKNPDDREAKGKLVDELKAFESHLKAQGPYIAGAQPTDSDFALIPKLRHLQVALKHYFSWKIPSQNTATLNYIELLQSRPSFQKSDSPDDMIIQGWGQKVELSGPVVQSQAA